MERVGLRDFRISGFRDIWDYMDYMDVQDYMLTRSDPSPPEG